MTKIKTVFQKHKYFFCIFTGVLSYTFFVVLGGKLVLGRSIGLSFYALDYEMGFKSRILPGAVYRLITGGKDVSFAAYYHLFLLIGFFCILSIVLEKLLLSQNPPSRKTTLLLLFFFLTGPVTFAVFVPDNSVLEFHLMLIALLGIICLQHKPLQPVIVLLCAVELLVNTAAMICWVPLICVFVLYKISLTKTKKERIWLLAIFIMSVTVSFVLFFVLMLGEQKNLTYSFEEFHEILVQRGVKGFIYPEYYLYKRFDHAEESIKKAMEAVSLQTLSEFKVTDVRSLFHSLRLTVETVFRLSDFADKKRFLQSVIIILPVFVLICRFFIAFVRDKEKSGLQRFCYFCMGMAFFLTFIPGVFMSWDPDRWMAYAFIQVFAALLYVIYHEREESISFLSRIFARFSLPQIIVYGLCYAVVYFI